MTNGLVLQIAEQYIPLSPNRVHERLPSVDAPFTNVFNAEMLRHLPLAKQMTTLFYGGPPD